MVLYAELNLLNKILQIGLQLDRDVLHIKPALVGIAEDRRDAVVGSDDDEAIGRVEDIKGCIAAGDMVGGRKLKFFRILQRCFHVGIHELHGHLADSIHVNPIGLHSHCEG